VVSVIIINYNTFQLTCACIESVVAHTTIPYEIILVDNCSTECDADRFKDKFPFIRLIKNPVNNGFASGNNLGIAATKGDIILLLNSDTYLTESSIDKSVNYLINHADLSRWAYSIYRPSFQNFTMGVIGLVSDISFSASV
jgi:GT2 family glycosyltransferase